jgi:hypothetical protein
MVECGCVIAHTTAGVSVKLCGAHSYGTDMLPLLRRFLEIFTELEARYGRSLTEAYHDTLHEARALLRKVEDRPEAHGDKTDRQAPGDTQSMIDSSTPRTPASSRDNGPANKLA